MKEIGVVMRLSEFGVTNDAAEKIADFVIPMNGGYKPLTREEVVEILKKSV